MASIKVGWVVSLTHSLTGRRLVPGTHSIIVPHRMPCIPALNPQIEHANGPRPYLDNNLVFSSIHVIDGVKPLDPCRQLQERRKIDCGSARVIAITVTTAFALRLHCPRRL